MQSSVRIILLLALSSLLWSARSSDTTELAALSPQTWDEYALHGKEADAIYGDWVLRNDQIAAVIASPMEGRHANMHLRNVGGCVIDLTRRGERTDELGAYYPASSQFRLRFAGVETRSASAYEVSDPRQLFVRADEVSLHLVGSPTAGNPDISVRYRLRRGRRYLLVETVYSNPTEGPVQFELLDLFRADRSRDLRTPEIAPNGMRRLFWTYDKWIGQAYGLVCDGREIHYETGEGAHDASNLTYLAGGEKQVELQPGKVLRLTRRIFPGSNLFQIKAIANELAGIDQKPVLLQVKDSAGNQIEGADVVVSAEEGRYAWGRTGSDGKLTFHIPPGDYEATVSALGRGSKSFPLNVSTSATYSARLEEPGYLVAEISDGSGSPIPAKVQFRGRGGTPDPFFGPDSGEHTVYNLYYSHNGRLRQSLPPGTYEVIVSRGPEYDAVFTELEIHRGKESFLRTTLVRTVRTPGWVTSDFHSHSSPSGDNTSSQLGRVLNLLCEQIEFAPCTEHNQISTYIPHLKRLGVENLMATCSGIELSGTPGAINHQNAFPLLFRPHTQDGGAPRTSFDPEIQIARLALWDNRSEKLTQVNHPDMGQLFLDRNGDRQPDEGYTRMFGFIDVIEVHPPAAIFAPPLIRHPTLDLLFNNRIFNWLQLLNQGVRIPGVVNTDAHANFHGSGFLRNYVKSAVDDPAKIRTMDMVRSATRGNVIMTNGPYLEVKLETGNPGRETQAIAGDEVMASEGKVLLQVRVQCPNWFDIDRVQIFLNGRPRRNLNFTRQTSADSFSDDTVRFERRIDLDLAQDTHIIVAAVGEKSMLGRVMGPRYGKDLPIAVSNPIFVDVDGGGFQANRDTLGAPLPVKQ